MLPQDPLQYTDKGYWYSLFACAVLLAMVLASYMCWYCVYDYICSCLSYYGYTELHNEVCNYPWRK